MATTKDMFIALMSVVVHDEKREAQYVRSASASIVIWSIQSFRSAEESRRKLKMIAGRVA